MSAEPLTAQDIEWLRRLANDRVSVRHFNTIFLSTRSAQLVLALLDERDAAIRRAESGRLDIEEGRIPERRGTGTQRAAPVARGWLHRPLDDTTWCSGCGRWRDDIMAAASEPPETENRP